ncbi:MULTISPECIES: bestrophin family protein [unclassified Sphingomonas]|uniref:bestrophin family protein n=1 Tax=unclassified Sphingomonas TaxID=196159 RepID=UPI0009289A5F|nr:MULTISPECIES: bestrophin family protein [unclassified Sphingomonas]OJU17111.1 MAG: bestrophin [Sphingomonas sp. 66-10]
MIVRSQPSFRDIAIAVNGSILPRITRRLCVIACVSVVAIIAAQAHPGIFARISAIPFTLIGIALSVFMSFRNNACYARWWEGRQLWGELIVSGRSLARVVSQLDEPDRVAFLRGVCAFASGLVAKLRGADDVAAIKLWVDIGQGAKGPNPVNAVLDQMGQRAFGLMRDGTVNPIHYSVIDAEIGKFAKIQGACERIATTPVPFAYSLLLQRTALVFCVILPFALAGSLDWWTLLPVLLVAYTFFGLDALGHELEDPFGIDPNCLPLYALRRTVEREMLSLLGCEELPAPQEPRDGILR